jgi:hypothetical protein
MTLVFSGPYKFHASQSVVQEVKQELQFCEAAF